MEKVKLLVVSDDAEFVNALMQSCRRFSSLPEFNVSGASGPVEHPESTVAVLDGSNALAQWSGEESLAIAITSEEPLPELRGALRRVVQIRRTGNWADIAAALANEAVLRIGAMQQVMEAERQLRECERFATLGRFIAGARHALGNALTCVLGNSELVLLEAESGLRDEARAQLETIHSMSLKIHETLQRLSSLDMEMQLAERQAQRETLRAPAKALTSQ